MAAPGITNNGLGSQENLSTTSLLSLCSVCHSYGCRGLCGFGRGHRRNGGLDDPPPYSLQHSPLPITPKPVYNFGDRNNNSSSNSNINNNDDDSEPLPFALPTITRPWNERDVWYHLLNSTLSSNVFNQEKDRLQRDLGDNDAITRSSEEAATSSVDSMRQRNFYHKIHKSIWFKARAFLNHTSVIEETHSINVFRAVYVQSALKEVEDFKLEEDVLRHPDAVEVALKKVQEVLHRIDQVEDLYPTLKDFGEEVPKYAEPQFQDRLATLNTWSRDVILVRQLAAMLTKRMGNSDFFTQSSSGGIQDVKRNVLTDVLHEKDEDDLFRSHKQEGTILIHEHPQQQQQQQQQQPLPLPLATAKIPLPTKGGVIINGQEPFLDEDIQRMKPGMDISFAEKLLKEKGFKDTFRQRFLQQLSLTLKRVKDDMITYADRYASMNLPVTDKTLEMLVEFPSKLVKAILWLRLSYARRLVNLTNTQLEQTLADFHQSLELACKVRRDFLNLARPAPGWKVNISTESNFQSILMMSLKFSLWLIERKLQRSSARPIALELEVMESEWDRLTKVAKDINGGTHEVINQFCYLAQEIIRRFARLIENDMNGPKNYYEMHSRGLAKWFSATTKALQSRLHKLQGLIRFLSNALANSLDVRFTSAQGVLDMLAGAKFLLVDAKGEWKQRGTYLVASSGMAACPAFAAELMASPAIDRSLLDEKYNECYLIVIQVDSAAEGNVVWRGKTLESLPSGIAHIDLEIPAGTMRIISAGSSRLEEHSKKLGEIFGVELFPLFKFGSQANNSSFAKGGSSNGNGGKDGKLGIGPDGRRHSSSHRNPPNSKSKKAHRRHSFSTSEPHIPFIQPVRQMAKPHTPMIRRLWDSVMHTLAEFWQMVVEYPFMIRAIHLEYHHRQFCEFVARKRHSEINSEDIVSLYNDPLLSLRPPPGKDGQAAAAKSDPATSARRPPRSSVTTPSELERYDDSSDAGNLTATVLPRRRPRSHSSSHHNREDDACRKKLQQPLVYNPGIIHMQCTDECDPLENVFSCFLLIFSSLGLITRHLEDNELEKCRRRLVELCTEWCGFIAEDCIVSSEKTFGWTMKVFEAITSLAPQEDISHMPDQEWELLKARVAGCLRVLIFHFDVLGARSEKRKMQRREQVVRETEELRSLILSFTRESSENPASVTTTSNTPDTDVEKGERTGGNHIPPHHHHHHQKSAIPEGRISLLVAEMNAHARAAKQEREKKVRELNSYREYMAKKYNHMGRVLEVTAHPEDQTLRQLAQSKSNISIRWEMGHYLGGGAFGHVYQGRNLDTAELMAVKEIRFPELGAPATEQESKDIVARKRRNPKEIARLRNLGRSLIEEMEVMSRLSHPNIVTYYGIEVRRDRVYLFMEYCEAGSLSKLLAESEALTEKVVQWYVVQILRGLKYLHQLGIVHRDIKPENILLHSNDMIKLVDFGAAKMLNMRALSFSKPHRNSKYSRQNTLTGTPAYMAPETIKNDPSDRGRLGSQDIWALGCCIFELITSEPPWSDMDNEWAIMFRIANESPPLPTNGDLSDIGMDFLKKCFTRPASLRPTAEELLKHPWLNNATRDLERFEERLSHHHHSVGAQDGTGSFMSEDHPSTPGSSSKRQEAGFPFPSISSTATGSSSHQPGSAAARALNDEHRRLGSSGRHTEPRTLSIGSDADMSDSSLSRIRYSRMPLGQPPDHGSSRGMVTGNSCASTINSETTSNPPPSHLPTLSDASIQSPTASTVAGVQNPLAPDMHSDNPQSISVIESLLHLASQNDDHESGSQQHKYQAPSTIGTTLRVTINELFSEGIKKLGLEDLQASSTDRDGVVGPTSDSDNTAKRRQLQTECGAGASVAGEKETEEEGEETLPEVLEKYFREKVDYIVSSYLSIPIESTYGGETIHSGSVTTQMQVFSENEIRAAAETLYACFVQRYRQYRYYQRLLLRYQQQMRDAGQEITACNPSDVLQFESMHMPAHLGGARGHDQPVVQQEDSKTVPLVTVSGPGVPTTEPRAVAYDVVSMLSNSLSTTVEEEGEEGDVDDDEPTALGASADEDEGNINPFSDAEEVGDIGTFTGTAALLKDNDASIDRDQGSPDSGDDCSIGEIVKGRSASVSRSSSMRISRVRTSQEVLQEMARYKLELEPPAIEPMFSTDVTPASTPYHDTPDHHSTDDVNSGSGGGGGEAGFPFDPPRKDSTAAQQTSASNNGENKDDDGR